MGNSRATGGGASINFTDQIFNLDFAVVQTQN